jgi:hypothetical protein
LKRAQENTTYLVEVVVFHAADVAKMAFCAVQKMTCCNCDRDKYMMYKFSVDKIKHKKNMQMKTTYLVEVVVLHATGGTKIAVCAPQARGAKPSKSYASPAHCSVRP